MFVLPFLASFLLGTPMSASSETEAPGIVHVEISKEGRELKVRDAEISWGRKTTVDARTPFAVPVASCLQQAGHAQPDTGGAVGMSGAQTTVEPRAITAAGRLTLRVAFETAELIRLVPTQAGACQGQTNASLKYDAQALFDLVPGVPQPFIVGDYTVIVTLTRMPPKLVAAPGAVAL